MTKSKNGCLKILVCAGAGSDPSPGSDADDHADESKTVSDKSRWSFRRRSTRHRVLKNSDISEPETLSSSKSKAEVAPGNNVYSSTYSYASEKPLHLEKPDEKPQHLEKPDEKTLHLEKPDEEPLHLEKLDEKLLDEEKLNEKPVEKPEKLGDLIAERSAELPDEKITGILSEDPAERIAEESIEEPAERIAEESIEETAQKAVEKLGETPDKSISISSTDLKQEDTASPIDGSSTNPAEDHVESANVVIQSGIRTDTERQELSDHKDLVKLQAVIRGHLVRKQAAESLQCLLSIVKAQGFVRAHQAQQSAEMFQDTLARSSSEKLLQNGFAFKLMDSMQASKSINIKCDHSETDVTWKWMERWTCLITPTTGGHLLDNSEYSGLMVETEEDAQHEEKNGPSDSDIFFPELVPDDAEERVRSSDYVNSVEETLWATDSSALEAPTSVAHKISGPEIKDDSDPQLIEKINVDAEQLTEPTAEDVVEKSFEFSGQQSLQTEPSRESNPVHEKSDEDIMISYKTEQASEMEGKSFAARKSWNSAFAAAQMKFEELTSNSAVSRSNSSSYLDGPSKSKVHTARSLDGASPKQNCDTSIPEVTAARDTKTILAASECGTEISISSTLDSPDRSEADGGEIVLEIGSLGGRDYAPDNADKDTHILHSEVNNTSEGVVQPEKAEENNGEIANPAIAMDAVLVEEANVGLEKPDLNDQLERSVESYAKSPEGTPVSRTTFAESHGTPSSEVSVNTTKSKSKKPKSRVTRRSLTSPSSNSVGRRSTDNFSKDYKHAKRESSVKTAKADDVDQEPRMSNSTPLPSYMQFTESARAKAAAVSLSPKASPDLQDSNPRKRHSLPIANGRQETSPRMQRSSSQAQQNTKINVAIPHNPSDKRWNI